MKLSCCGLRVFATIKYYMRYLHAPTLFMCLFLLNTTCLFFADSTAHANPAGNSLQIGMDEAISIGITNSFLLKSIRHKQSSIRSLITERWRAYLPALGLSYVRTRSINDANEDTLSHKIRFNIEQVVYDGGQRSLDLDRAKLDFLLNRHDFLITYNELQLQVREAYLRSIAARGKILLNQKSLARAKIELRHTQLERKIGFATDAQVYTVAARVREIELALQQSRNSHTTSLHDLRQILNLDFRTDIHLTDSLFNDFYLAPPRADLGELVLRARNQRPEIKRALAAIHRQRKELQMVEREWIPRLSLNGYSGRNGEQFPLREKEWGLGFSITMPLGSSKTKAGSNYSNMNNGEKRSSSSSGDIDLLEDLSRGRRELESKSALATSVSDYQRLNNSLAIEIHRNYDQAHENWEAIRIGNGQVYFQYISLQIQKTRYKVGGVRRADIVEAERDLVRAQESLTDAVANYIISIYKLEFSSALNPGHLNLIHLKTNQGNTILRPLHNENFGRVKRQVNNKQNQIEDQMNLKDSKVDDENYLIEGIEFDEK